MMWSTSRPSESPRYRRLLRAAPSFETKGVLNDHDDVSCPYPSLMPFPALFVPGLGDHGASISSPCPLLQALDQLHASRSRMALIMIGLPHTTHVMAFAPDRQLVSPFLFLRSCADLLYSYSTRSFLLTSFPKYRMKPRPKLLSKLRPSLSRHLPTLVLPLSPHPRQVAHLRLLEDLARLHTKL